MESIKKEPLSKEKIINNYGKNKGSEWMLEKRIKGLINLRLIEKENSILTIEKFHAKLLTYIFLTYKMVFKLKSGG